MGSEASSLGDRLYNKVEEQLEGTDRQFTGNITGMMLELEDPKIEELLKSPDLLQSAVNKSLVICKECVKKGRLADVTLGDGGRQAGVGGSGNTDVYKADMNAGDRDRHGDLLFEEVERICPNDAAKVTGMLLELESSLIKQLLSSPQLLQSAIHKALAACRESSTGGKQGLDDGVGDMDSGICVDRERLGDLLYDKVHRIYPDEAPKLTGMLLEQDLKYVHKLLLEDQLFYQCLQKARQAIKGNS